MASPKLYSIRSLDALDRLPPPTHHLPLVVCPTVSALHFLCQQSQRKASPSSADSSTSSAVREMVWSYGFPLARYSPFSHCNIPPYSSAHAESVGDIRALDAPHVLRLTSQVQMLIVSCVRLSRALALNAQRSRGCCCKRPSNNYCVLVESGSVFCLRKVHDFRSYSVGGYLAAACEVRCVLSKW